VPSRKPVSAHLKWIDLRKLDVDRENRTVRLPAGMQADLGGIAKGYIVLARDLNVSGALAALNDGAGAYGAQLSPGNGDSSILLELRALDKMLDTLGILDLERTAEKEHGLDAAQIEALIVERREARASKNRKRADEIRDELAAMGVVLEDSSTGTRWTVGA
jgi:cysteinyl-tRNA synthetase